MVDGIIDDLNDGRTAGFPSVAQYAFLVIGPLLVVALLLVGLPTVRWVGRLRVLAEACTVSPAVLFMGYTFAVSVIQRSSDVVRGNLALVLTIGLIDLVAVTVCALVLVESRTTPRLLMTLSFFLLLVGDVLLGVDYWTDPRSPSASSCCPGWGRRCSSRSPPSTPGRRRSACVRSARSCARWSSTRPCSSPTSSASGSSCGAAAA